MGAEMDLFTWNWAAQQGITAVVAVQDEYPDPVPPGRTGIMILWAPTPDIPSGPLEPAWLQDTVAIAEHLYRSGRKLYIHCIAGVSRSATVTAALLMRLEGLPFEVAFQRVRACRGINPHPPYLELLRTFR